MPSTCNVVVLISGSGSNLQALIDDIYLPLAANTNYMLVLEPDSSAYGGYRLSVAQ